MSRELLEKAAKAAGIDLTGYHFFAEKNQFVRCWEPSSEGTQRFEVWGPLTDDGDEARLEASLQMHVEWHPGRATVRVGTAETYVTEPYGKDRQAARRLAGVRAAAAMGEQ